MNHDGEFFRRKMQKLSVVKKCPRCGQLALKSKDGEISCENCGYSEKVPTLR